MTSDRSSVIKIGDKEYALTLTTKATKEIAKKYGGLENLGDKLMKSENFELAISEIIWLLTLLANQSLLIHNLRNPKDKKELLTEEEVELLTTPADLVSQKEAIVKAMAKGTNRNIESESTKSKNKAAE
nr:MAG TPA: tail assembly chaperone protein [Caudoviricetes sp.]